MAYSITTTIGNPIATVQDATINTSATPLTLIGRDYAGYGAFLNENFVHLLENFAANTAPAQAKRLTGMLWYDTSTIGGGTLKVWNIGANVWKPVGSSISQADSGLSSVDSTQLFISDLKECLNVFKTSNNQTTTTTTDTLSTDECNLILIQLMNKVGNGSLIK